MSKLRVIVWKEENLFIGQGLERDLCVQGADLNDIQRRMDLQIRILGLEPGGLAAVPEAPKALQDLWESRQKREIVKDMTSAGEDLRVIFDLAAAA